MAPITLSANCLTNQVPLTNPADLLISNFRRGVHKYLGRLPEASLFEFERLRYRWTNRLKTGSFQLFRTDAVSEAIDPDFFGQGRIEAASKKTKVWNLIGASMS